MVKTTIRLLASAVALSGLSVAASAAPLPAASLKVDRAIVQVDAWCGPGYHIGAGGRHCWPNGYAPAVEIPPGYVVPGPVVVPAPPVFACPPGYHLGSGLRRCWPN